MFNLVILREFDLVTAVSHHQEPRKTKLIVKLLIIRFNIAQEKQ